MRPLLGEKRESGDAPSLSCCRRGSNEKICSMAEMSSSRAGVEAALSDTKSEPEAAAAGQQIADLLRDCKDNAN